MVVRKLRGQIHGAMPEPVLVLGVVRRDAKGRGALPLDEVASRGNAMPHSCEVEGRKMFRTIKIGAIVALANVVGAQSAGSATLTWGIFRENAPNISESLRNCWTQAMVSGQTINGEIMAQNLTEQKAQLELQSFAKRGECAAERTSATWSARGQGRSGFGEADGSASSFGDASSFGGASTNGPMSDWSGADRFGGGSGQSHAGPMGGR
jgi:hypothetical protein